MSDHAAEPMSDLEAENVGLTCEPGVGLTIADDGPVSSHGARWLCWSEVVALHAWLGQKIGVVTTPLLSAAYLGAPCKCGAMDAADCAEMPGRFCGLWEQSTRETADV